MQLKTWLATCSLICLLAVQAVSMDGPYKIYDEARLGPGTGNVYYFGGVFDDTAYVGHIGHGANQWGDEQIGGTACLNATDHLLALNPNNVAKSAFPLGGWIYMSNGAGNLCRVSSWSAAVAPQELPSPVLMSDGNPVYCDCITTDGTYIYVSTGTGAINGPYFTIYKYSVNHAAGTISLVWQSAIPGSTTSTHRFRAISYYNGKLYTANNKGATVGHIFEVDCVTGAITDIATMNPTGAAGDPYQVVRYGNQLFVVSLNDCLYTFNYSGGTWTQAGEPVSLGVGDLYGIAVKGDGTTAKYAWISHDSSTVSFWDLNPDWTTAHGLGEARKAKNNYPVVVNNAVVTKVGTGQFWIEDADRAAGCRVASDTAVTVGKLVTVKGGMGITDSGEKVLNALEVTLGADADPAIKPLYLTNKNMGPTAGSAGLATDGMLVKVSGMLTLVDPYDAEFNPTGKNALYIDDGSAVANDKEGTVTGLKVTTASLIDVPDIMYATPGSTEVTVTGIVRLEKLTDGTVIRKIEALSDTDIVLTTL